MPATLADGRASEGSSPSSASSWWKPREEKIGWGTEVIPTPVVGHGLVFASFGKAGPNVRDSARRIG
jgi:hypothetical protein